MRTANIVDTLAAANFVANEAQVEQLASVVVQGNQANGTYLRVLVATLISRLGTAPRRRRKVAADVSAAQDEALTLVHESFYPHVLAGVGPDDLDKLEKHRRAAFARSAASTLRAFIRGGGDVRTLEPATVSKNALRKAIAPPEPANRLERSLQRAETALVRALARMRRADPAMAEAALERIVGELEDVTEGEPEAAQRRHDETTVITSHRLQRAPAAEPRAGH